VQGRAGGGADIWGCSKVPFALREQVAIAFGQSVDNFVVHPCYIGGCFGGKGDFMDVPACYLLSLKTGRPVKMVMDYGEEFIAGNPRHAAIVRVKSGAKKDGRLVAHRMDYVFDSGAYAAFKPQGYLVGPKEAAGPYNIPNVFIEEKIVYTNKIPCGHMRAPGDPQGFFANESQMDLIARRLNMDPIEFRKKNLMRDGDVSPIGHVVPHIKSHEIVDEAVRASGYEKPKGKRCGRGVAVAQWLPLGGECHAFVTIDVQGNVTVATAMLDQGAGTHTAMRLVTAEELKAAARKDSYQDPRYKRSRTGHGHRGEPWDADFRQRDTIGGRGSERTTARSGEPKVRDTQTADRVARRWNDANCSTPERQLWRARRVLRRRDSRSWVLPKF
jgi:CO/xanthine dehydrogenase Mo-binding subunit